MATEGSLQSLNGLRLRLTAWYASTFLVILLLLGAGVFVAVRRQITAQLRDSLRAATTELGRAAQIREVEQASARGPVADAVEELRIPDRALFLLDTAGRPIKPDTAPAWVRAAARIASRPVDLTHETGRDETLLLHAERVRLATGRVVVAAAVASQMEVEDEHAALIGVFAGAALVALLLVAAGGWLLARRSTEPAERTIAFMRRFMADAAHELRTPLTVLRSRAEIALQQERDARGYVSALRAIEGDSRQLGAIVEDLLTLARADAGERPLVKRRLYLDDVAIEAARGARALAQAKGVTLSVDEFEEAVIDGDEALIRQLVLILLDNAVKFTPAGGNVGLTIASHDGRATLAVEDTGIGIPPEQVGRVFERFFRGDAARTRVAADGERGGAGLGLAIARWICDAHGAVIALESPASGGTRARVTFPPTRDGAELSSQ